MKQFARCTNCRQWYMHSATLLVDVVRGNGFHHTTLWCQSCVSAAEARSRSAEGGGEHEPIDFSTATSRPSTPRAEISAASHFQGLIQEHLDLMERALHEDDEVLVPLIDDFMHRCRTIHEQLEQPERAQRLAGHMQYWDTFLQTLRRSS